MLRLSRSSGAPLSAALNMAQNSKASQVHLAKAHGSASLHYPGVVAALCQADWGEKGHGWMLKAND